MKLETSAPRILDFDIECRPLAWYGGDWVTKEPTAIAFQWLHLHQPQVFTLAEHGARIMHGLFVDAYNQADLVTGHFIRGFDLPLLNAYSVRLFDKPLEAKLTQDTKLDLTKRHGQSNSLENLAAEFQCEHDKYTMTTTDWEEANRLTTKGTKRLRQRASSDVELHIELRRKLLLAGLLSPPRKWSPEGKGTGKYHA